MRWAGALLMAACHAPEVKGREDDPVDSATIVVDSADAPVESIAPCTGHDEDYDGFPDDCDTCPSIPNPTQLRDAELNPLFGQIGPQCYPDGGYAAATKRALFDPFTEASSRWKISGSAVSAFRLIMNPPRTGPDAMSGGEFQELDKPPVEVAIMRTEGPAKTLVLTMVIERLRGDGAGISQGIFARGGGSPYRFIACYISEGHLHLGVVDEKGCAGTQCTFRELAPKLTAPMLADRTSDQVGLRLELAPTATGADLTCRSFDPREPITLTSAVFNVINKKIGTADLLPGNELGVFAYRVRVDVGSIDLLSE